MYVKAEMNSSATTAIVANQDESLKLENTKLRSINAELSSQNDSLRKQIDQSLQITNKIQDVYKENEKLRSELTRSAGEKEDLQKRLQINYLQIQELTQRVNSQTNISKEFGSKVDANENIFKKQISDLNEKLVLTTLKNEQLQAEKEKFEACLSQILEQASLYFNDDIQNIGDLISHFEKIDIIKPNILTTTMTSVSDIKPTKEYEEINMISKINNNQPSPKKKSGKSEEVFKLKRKIKQLKMILQGEIKKEQEIQNNANDKIRSIENQNELKMIEVTSQVKKISEQLEQQKKLNNELSLKNESLNKDNAKLESQLQLSKIQTAETDSEKVIQLSNHISDLNEKLTALKDVNQEYKNSTIPNLVAKNRSLKTKITALTEKMAHLKEIYTDENNKNISLNEQFEKRSNELMEKIAQKETENTKLKFENETIRNKLLELNRDYKQEQMEKETIKNENENLSKIIKQNKEMSTSLESQLHEYSQKYAKTTAELETTRSKLEIANRPINITKLIPLACWSVPEIPKDLTIIIEDIVKNDTLELPTKLRHVLTVICKWFQTKTDRLENEISSTNTNSLTLNGLLETVKEFLKNTFPDFSSEKIQEIVDDNSSTAKELFKDYIQKKSDSFNDLFELKSKMDEEILDLLMTLKVDQIKDGIQKVERLYSKNKKLKQVIQKLKGSNKKITDDCLNEIKSIEQTIQTKDSLIDELNRKNELLTNMISKSEEALKNSEEELKKLEDSKKQLEEKFNETKQKNQQRIQKANETIQNLKIQYENLNAQYNSSQDKVEELGITINDLHDVINDITDSKKLLEEKIKELLNQIEEINKKHKEKSKEIKKQAQQRYDEMLNQMKKQNADCRDTITSLNNEKLNLIDHNENLEKMITELNLKIQKMELKSSELTASSNRDKRSQESLFTTQLLSMKNDYQNQIEKVENSKNRLVDLIRNQFKPFFRDMRFDFDQKSVEEIINLVGQKLKSLNNN